MLTAVPQQHAGHLDQPQIVGHLLLVAHQNSPALRKPAQRTLHHPPASRVAFDARLVELLLSNASDVGYVASLLHKLPARTIVVAFIQAQVLRSLLGGSRAIDHDGIERRLQQLEIRHIGSGHNHRERAAIGFHKERSLDAHFGSVSGIGAYEIPPKRALPIAPSAACHSKSTPPISSHSSMSFSQMRSNTPNSIHRWKVRCTEESSGNSSGNRFHWQPLLILKMIASSAARWLTRGLPVLFGGSCSSKIGPIFSHNSSGTRQMVGMGFSWIEFSDIADSYSDGHHQR